MKDDACWVVAHESSIEALSDWASNLNIFGRSVLQSTEKHERAIHCGCQEYYHVLGFPTPVCKEYHECVVAILEAHPGFVGTYNSMRYEIVEKLREHCNGARVFNYAGYSRGAALVSLALVAYRFDGFIKDSDYVRLITFGGPRVLEKQNAEPQEHFIDEVHRAVYCGRDPVPGLPQSTNIFDSDKYWDIPGPTYPDVGNNGPYGTYAWQVWDYHVKYGDIYNIPPAASPTTPRRVRLLRNPLRAQLRSYPETY